MDVVIQAVVLRKIFADESAIALYTPRYGRLKVLQKARKKQWEEVSTGDICLATIEFRQGKAFLLNLESVVTRSPVADATSFFWQSHLLEMYFYYVPLEQPNDELFALLTYVMRLSVAPDILFKACLAQFFSLLGYHVPEEVFWYRDLFGALDGYDDTSAQRTALDARLVERYEVKETQNLDHWLLSTVREHDHFRYLKTQQFLPHFYT